MALSKQKNGSPLINEMINAKEILLIDEDGTKLGVKTKEQGLELAQEKSLDLILMSNSDGLPVCKIMEYGKYKYDKQKKQKKNKKKQKNVDTKEIKIRPSIQTHDYNVKIQKAREFLTNGDKVKIMIRLRGRELMFKNIAYDLADKITNDLINFGKIAQKNNEKEGESGNIFCIFTTLTNNK